MNHKEQLHTILNNPKLSTKHKIAQLQGFKCCLEGQLRKGFQAELIKKLSYKQASLRFTAIYNCLRKHVSEKQSTLLSQHQQCIEELEDPNVGKSLKMRSLQKMYKINLDLSSLVRRLKEEKPGIQQLSLTLVDHLKLKKAKLSFQHETKTHNEENCSNNSAMILEAVK